MIFRSWVWPMPLQPAIRMDARPKVTVKLRLSRGEVCRSRVMGAIFCQVDKISPVGSEIP